MLKKFSPIFMAAICPMALFLTVHAAKASPVAISLVQVSDTNNAADPTVMATDATSGYGSVGYIYSIGATDVTLAQYAAFLNAVAQTDPYGLYNPNLASDDHVEGIAQGGTFGAYTYSVIGNGQDPVTYVSWLDAARFCNWLQNGQPTSGVEGPGTTEQGAYTLNGDTTNGLETKNVRATWWIPAENEWYKAAYYDPTLNAGSGGYWPYPTQSTTTPGNDYLTLSVANQANYYFASGLYSVTQNATEDPAQNYLTPVESFTSSASHYQTYDQGGNVYQWNDAVISGSSRGVRGGSWAPSPNNMNDLQSNDRESRLATAGDSSTGFRVATSMAPTPVISSALSATGQEGVAFTYDITANNNPSSFGASGLPTGLGVSTSTGVISGTPTQSGSFEATVRAIGLGGTGSATLALLVLPLAPAITSSTLTQTGTDEVAFSYQITASNTPTSFTASGLPGGLTVDGSTGLISGTVMDSGTFFPVTVSAINTGGTGSATVPIVVEPYPLPVITSGSNVSGTINAAFHYQIEASNSPTGFSASGLPPNLTVDGSTGLISGTPASTGTFMPTISVMNLGGTDSETLTVTIFPPAPMITSGLTASGSNGSVFLGGAGYQIAATNSPTSFNASGLPMGLSVNTLTGLISGTLDAGGIFPVTISASNAGGTGSATLVLTSSSSLTTGMQGSYEGLGAVGGTNEGLFTLTMAAKGVFTGKLTVPGAQYTMQGTFSSNYGNFGAIVDENQTILDIILTVNAASKGVSGTLIATNVNGTIRYSLQSGLLKTYTAATLPNGLAGYYTAIIPVVTVGDPTLPDAPGYGTMTVTSAGAVSISGKLGDGTPFSAKSQLQADGKSWTLYVPLYAGTNPGNIAGTMTFEGLADSDCDGTLDWIKPAQTSGNYYPGGFAASVDLQAAKYTASAATPPLRSGPGLSGTGNLMLVGGDLVPSIDDKLTFSSTGKVTVNAAGTTVTIAPTTGVLSGEFKNPNTNTETIFGGVVYPKPSAAGVGLFLGTSQILPDQTGDVEITQ